jgi:hypothetical protein
MFLTCGALETLFVIMMLCMSGAHTPGLIAWRKRLPQYAAWDCAWLPLYLFRARYYQQPPPVFGWWQSDSYNSIRVA